MLRNFLYLNTVALEGYLSALEDGLRVGSESEQSMTTDKSVGADARVMKGNLGKSTVGTRRTSGQDTPEARFARLIDIADKDPEALAWIEVLDPDNDLGDAGYGAMISGEADFYIPQMIQLLASGGELGRAFDLIDSLEPMADLLGLDKQGMPDKGQRDALRSAVDTFGADLVTIGEFDDSDWKVAAQLTNEYIRAKVDGQAQFVGKVAKRWPAGQGQHLLALPGTTLLSRQERRALQSKKPDNPDDDSFLNGPALMLDLLAIWR
jgi:hypothetical protein